MQIKICKNCKEEFVKKNTIQNKCKKCLAEIQKANNIKYAKKYAEKLKTKPKVAIKVNRNSLQEKVNKEAKERDKGKACISCGEKRKLFAGHYISVARSQKLRYDLRNIHGQCFECNNFKSGNPRNFRIGLIERYGEKFVEELERDFIVI